MGIAHTFDIKILSIVDSVLNQMIQDETIGKDRRYVAIPRDFGDERTKNGEFFFVFFIFIFNVEIQWLVLNVETKPLLLLILLFSFVFRRTKKKRLDVGKGAIDFCGFF